MLKRIHEIAVYTFCLSAVLAWLGGCAGLPGYAPVEPPRLTAAQAARVGAAVESKLLQMLGGPYHDETLAADLNRLGKRQVQDSQPLMITVADRNAAELYPLPGGRVIMTRGLLAGVRSRAELESLLAHAGQLSDKVYKERTTHSMVEATGQVLSTTETPYELASATLRLARLFEKVPCERECLLSAGAVPAAAGASDLPASIKRLVDLQPGYDLLAAAREYERSGDQGKAIASYLQAAAISPDEPHIIASLGLAYLRAGQWQPARLHLQRAVSLQPDYYRTLMGLGYLHLQQGQLPQANEVLAASIRLLAVTENLFLLAEVREQNGDAEGALALYRLVADADRSGKLGRTSADRLKQGGAAR